MALTQIDFNSFTTAGDIVAENKADGLFLSANKQNTRFYVLDQPMTSYIAIPKRFTLPLKIDMSLNMTIPGLYLLLNEGAHFIRHENGE
jgi:hypothetical protein